MIPIKITIVEDRPDLRKSLSFLIKQCAELELIGACANGEEALSKVIEAKPDVVLMDLHLPGMDGIECTRRIKALRPDIEIIMLTVEETSDDLVFKALQAGATGYLVKRLSMDKVLESIKAVHRGEVPITPNIARKILFQFSGSAPNLETNLDRITPREHEILKLVSRGFTNKEIARELGVESTTVETHLRNIYKKMRVGNRAEAAAKYSASFGGFRPL